MQYGNNILKQTTIVYTLGGFYTIITKMHNLKPYIIIIICFCCMATNIKQTNNKILLPLNNVTIDLISPASKVPDLQALTKIPNLNFNIPKNSKQATSLTFLSAGDKERFADLKEALYDTPNNIIWCARGGYGSARLIDNLFQLSKPNKEKMFIGYSDITALHLFLSQHWGWKTIHAAVPLELFMPDKDPKNFTLLADLINHKASSCSIDDLQPINNIAKQITTPIVGFTTGGNLTIIQTSIGTKWQIDSKNKILFVEDIDLLGYQVDRALYQLLQVGIFKDAKAIIFGTFSRGDELVWRVITEFCNSKLTIPAYKSQQFGHDRFNRPIIYNARSEIKDKDKQYKQLIMYLE